MKSQETKQLATKFQESIASKVQTMKQCGQYVIKTGPRPFSVFFHVFPKYIGPSNPLQ